MRAVIRVVYVVMAAWLLLAGIIRIGLLLREGYPLDGLPFVSIGIALVAAGVITVALRRERGAPGRDDEFPPARTSSRRPL